MAGLDGFTVLPASAGLVSTGGEGSDGCPLGEGGGGCAPEDLEETVGRVSLPRGPGQAIEPGATLDVGFEFAPLLDESDVAKLSAGEGARLAVAVRAKSGYVRVLRQPIQSGDAPKTGPVTVTGRVPSGESEIVLPSVAPSSSEEAFGQFAYTTASRGRGWFCARFTAASPNAETTAVDLRVGLEGDPAALAVVFGAISPETVTVGELTRFELTSRSRAQINGPLTLNWGSSSVEAIEDAEPCGLIGPGSLG
jgi:hypothetical protein